MAKREIVTKTVINKTKKIYSDIITIQDHEVSKVLGCWLLNPVLRYEKRNDNTIVVSGTYDINLWVACNQNTTTKSIIQQQEFSYDIHLDVVDEQVMGELIAYAKWLSKPLCTKAETDQHAIHLTIDQEFQLEWIGETKIRVEMVDDEIDQIIDQAIDTQYLLK